jgi:ParB/RepB/Spo0J family partition protein
MIEIEFHQLRRPYESLRIASKSRIRQLLSSIDSEGQQTPVLVVESSEGSYVLIDGYHRVAALEKLGRDTVEAVVLSLDEGSALIFAHQQSRHHARSALEDAWLIELLTEQCGLSQHAVACRLGHNQSWISRRLALLTALPESVQELVRQGRLPAYPASKYLVPMARAIKEDCEKLAANLAGHRLSTRQVERLYIAWKSGDDETRARLVEEPLLFLKAARELEQEEPPHPDAALTKELETIGDLSRRVMRRLSRRSPELEAPQALIHIRVVTQEHMIALLGLMKERFDD